MARRRPGLVAIRRILAGALLFIGLFVLCFGFGYANRTVAISGATIMVLALGARVATSFRRAPRQWLQGTGHVLEVSEPPEEARFGRCSIRMVVDAPGQPSEEVLVNDARVPVAQWPKPGDQFPIQVAADDVRNVRVRWRYHVPVETGFEAAFEDDQPPPVPPGPPPSQLDFVAPTGIDFDIDGQPEPIRPVAPAQPGSAEAGEVPSEAATPDEGWTDKRRTDEGRTDEGWTDEGWTDEGWTDEGWTDPDVPVDNPPGTDVPVENQPDADVPVAGQRVPRPRPSPRPRPAPGPPPAGAASPAAAATATATETTPATLTPEISDLVTSYPSAHPVPAGAIHGVSVTISVADLDRSVAFYRDKLGFYEVDGGADGVVLASGETRLVLVRPPDLGPVNRRFIHLLLEVADVESMYDELKRSGIRFTSSPRPVNRGARLELWAASFRDPDGHGIAISQWRPA